MIYYIQLVTGTLLALGIWVAVIGLFCTMARDNGGDDQ